MNSLEVFRKMEADSEENDEVADPVDGLWHMHDAYVYTEDFSEPPIHVVDEGIQTKYSNDFCYCFFGIDEKHYVEQFNEKQKQKFLEKSFREVPNVVPYFKHIFDTFRK